jgi:cell division protease FtsH
MPQNNSINGMNRKNNSTKPNRPRGPQGPMGPNDPNGKTPATGMRNKNLMLILFIILMGIILIRMFNDDQRTNEIDRTLFYQMLEEQQVPVYKITLRKVPDGVLVSGERGLTNEEQAQTTTRSPLFRTQSEPGPARKEFQTVLLSVSEETQQQWEERYGIKINVVHDSTGWFGSLISLLPIFLMLALFWFVMMRQSGPSGSRGLFSFGKSRARMLTDKSQTTFQDVAGCDEAKQDLEEIVDFLKSPKKYDSLGGKIPKGALLLGPPGTGKTLLAKAVAGEAGVPFFSMSGSDFVEMFVGVGASRVRDLFETGKKHAPCILFIDEIDAVGRQRGAGLGGGHDEREQTLNQLLVEMDGFNGNEGVILLAATNRPDVLDKALLRPGRFDRQIVVDAPDVKGREEILKVHIRKRKVPVADDVNLTILAKGTPGLSGADLENLVNEAALLAARFSNKQVNMIDFEEAKDKIMLGPERKSRILTEEEKKTTAYHEAGHAIITLLMKHADPLHKLTIIPRGMALGITFSLPESDRYTMNRNQLEDRIAILLGGRAAEWNMFKQRTTGASNDIERATELARRMVVEWGMTDELGPLAYGKKKEEVFLGRDIAQQQDYSEETALQIDKAVRRIIDEQVVRVENLLDDNKEKLVALAEALLEHEVLDKEEIDRVLSGNVLESSKKSRQYKLIEEIKRNPEKFLRTAEPNSEVTEGPQPPSTDKDDSIGDDGKGNQFDQRI